MNEFIYHFIKTLHYWVIAGSIIIAIGLLAEFIKNF